MNEIRVTTRAVFNPGTKKPTPVRATAKAGLRVFTNGVPAVTKKVPLVKKTIKPAVFSPAVVKAAPVRITVKAKVKTARVTAKATAKPRSFVVRQIAKSRARLVLATGSLAKSHDNKTAVSKAIHKPVVTNVRQYRTVGNAISHVTYLRPLAPHDRKTAVAKAAFGSFNAKPPSFRWH